MPELNLNNYRYSKQRQELYDLLCSVKTHPTATWLYDQLRLKNPNLSLGTVYRNLNLLAAEGKIQILNSGSTFDRYDADVSEHTHLFCTKCGQVFDGEFEPIQTGNLEKATGFKVERTCLNFYGTCQACQGNTGSNSKRNSGPEIKLVITI